MAFTITYPVGITTDAEKLRWLFRYKKQLTVLHNRVGTWWREGGVTLNQYNNLLPQRIKNRYPYQPKLSDAEWNDFVELHRRIFMETMQEMLALQKSAEDDNLLTVDFDSNLSGT